MITERLNTPDPIAFADETVAIHFRITEDDELFGQAKNYVAAAAVECEGYAGLALLTQTVRVTLTSFPCEGFLPLPIAPVVQGATVTVEVDGVSFDDWALVCGQRPALWPNSTIPAGRVVIEYQAGFGADAASIPADLMYAIIDQALTAFDMSGPEGLNKFYRANNGLSPHAARVFGRYRRVML